MDRSKIFIFITNFIKLKTTLFLIAKVPNGSSSKTRLRASLPIELRGRDVTFEFSTKALLDLMSRSDIIDDFRLGKKVKMDVDETLLEDSNLMPVVSSREILTASVGYHNEKDAARKSAATHQLRELDGKNGETDVGEILQKNIDTTPVIASGEILTASAEHHFERDAARKATVAPQSRELVVKNSEIDVDEILLKDFDPMRVVFSGNFLESNIDDSLDKNYARKATAAHRSQYSGDLQSSLKTSPLTMADQSNSSAQQSNSNDLELVLCFAPESKRDELMAMLEANLSSNVLSKWTLRPFDGDRLVGEVGLTSLGFGLAEALEWKMKQCPKRGRCVFLGMDSPHLSREHLAMGLNCKPREAKLIPVKDGGYAMLALAYGEEMLKERWPERPFVDPFIEVAWSTDKAYDTQKKALLRAGYLMSHDHDAVAKDNFDVDDFDDLMELKKRVDGEMDDLSLYPRVAAMMRNLNWNRTCPVSVDMGAE